ncbi:hypothetical protein [Flavobacterium inviolabile]|uniref:hypothetical protein n=1 Tax=Flavobacterium inviolabile TaxID=2748320 RepID=UPI0015A7AB8D|nr:hypothetical protein [Flavobacterium inviolabile]
MNQKQIKTICYAVLFILGGLLTGCELEEDVIQKNAYRERLAIRNSTFDALSKEQPFVQALSGLNKGKHGKGSFSRTIMEAQYGFTILPDKAVVIEKEGKTSYTFQIVRETPDSTCFENLVIHTDNPGSTRAFIVKYTPEVPIVPSVTHESFYFSGAIRITPIEYNAELAGKKIVCVTATVMMCDQSWSGSGSTTPHVATQYCNNPNHLFEVTTTTCDMVAGGGSFGAGAGQYSGGDGMGGTGGGGGDGEPGNDDGLTPPNPCPRCPDFTTVPVLEDDPTEPSAPPTPCYHLKRLTDNPSVKLSFATLEARKNQPGEWGFAFRNFDSTSTSIMAPTVIEASSQNPNILNMAAYIGGNYIGAAHTHPPPSFGYYPMFSFDDLEYLMRVALKHNNGGQPKDWTQYVLTLTTYDGVFAIKIKDPLKFYTNFNLKRAFIENQIEKEYRKIKPGGNMDKFKLALLKIIEDFDLGMGLYEATDNVTKWGELENIKGKPNLKPC